ncbi:hypothetical protein [Peterkaempfera griseoplana]|uniref:hypothetical protein n=1 Tax=Peterkaempfera griseoplana TaxID=66896 RepID=UPI0006E3665F|nr:hypothetical protein [Peterkaempfera griseoplana]
MHPPEPEAAAPPPSDPPSATTSGGAVASRRLPRAVAVALATAGLLAVTAASAAVTVAVGRPPQHTTAAQAAPAPSATVSAPAGASASATPTAPASAPPSPSASPTPRSTVTGRVSGDAHTGDLRFFLLPVPGDAEVYGQADGTKLSLTAVAEGFGNAAQTKGILRDYGFRSAAYRVYRTADGSAEVSTRLIRFGSANKASWFVQGMSLHGTAFSVPGLPGARGFVVKPKQEGETGTLIGLFHQGDVEVEITVQVKGTPDKSVLTGLLKRQQKRLRTGR